MRSLPSGGDRCDLEAREAEKLKLMHQVLVYIRDWRGDEREEFIEQMKVAEYRQALMIAAHWIARYRR